MGFHPKQRGDKVRAVNVIEVESLVKKYNGLVAVDGISFTVAEGEVFGFLGPNGAGKTTTINILCTLLRPTSGTARLAGHDVVKRPNEVRRAIGLVFQDPSLDDRLSALENLEFHGVLYNVPGETRRKRIRELLEMVELWERRESPVRTFSGGMRRRLEIARGLLHYPRVLFLDEPTIGLDPQTRNLIWNYIHELRQREHITIFMTTHYMDEAGNAGRIAIIDRGRIVALDTPEALKGLVGGDVITMRTADDGKAAAEIGQRYQVAVHRTADGLQFEVHNGEEFIPRFIAELKLPVLSISLRRPTLDDVFLKLTGRQIRDDEATDSNKALSRSWIRAHIRGRR